MLTTKSPNILFAHWLGINFFLANFLFSSFTLLVSAQTLEKCSEQQALNWFEQGNGKYSTGELEQALQGWEKALNCYQILDRPQDISGLLINLAIVSREMRNYTISLDYLEQAQKIVENTTNDSQFKAFILENFGLTKTSLGHYQEAIKDYKQALELIESIDTTKLSE